MSRRCGHLRYERRDDEARVDVDLLDSEMHEVALGLALSLPLERQMELLAQIAMGPEYAPVLAGKIAAGMGSPRSIDRARCCSEEEMVE